jgi:hypothetical protein
VDAWRAPKRIFDAHPPDQYAQLRVDLRSPSLWARLPTPVAAKAGPVPTHEPLCVSCRRSFQDAVCGREGRQKAATELLSKGPMLQVETYDASSKSRTLVK